MIKEFNSILVIGTFNLLGGGRVLIEVIALP